VRGMDPQLGRTAFNIAFYFAFMSAVLLPFLKRDSPEFVAATLALLFSLLFLAVVIWEVRRQVKIAKGVPVEEQQPP
jgi:hypothetical protein